ncbi:MAG: protein translocase subunit SecD [Candidatus Pacebacteria bacterium]|nr:protein translocase subunit SecD [Candidatus Paceibacterota bacterium]MDD5357428.1 protein translocase subunit SecD [Candidatus Paceibacterota bacterium]
MVKTRVIAILLLAVTALLAFFLWTSEHNPASRFHFRLGLDLKGGTALTYKADVSKIDPSKVSEAMSTLRDVIERRVNLFGVSEPVVQVEAGGVVGSKEAAERLIVELPGVTDIKQAIDLIGKTPLLEFKLVQTVTTALPKLVNGKLEVSVDSASTTQQLVDTGLTGSLLSKASLEFNQNSSAPVVSLEFNSEGKDLFAKITKANIGKPLAIVLDGNVISAPSIREEIKDGKAQITGQFTVKEAQTLVRDLNYGSLPVPVELISTQTIGATLGEKVLNSGVRAGLWGFLIVGLFLILWYRLPGVLAVVALVTYVVIMLTLFKVIPVTITSAGIAGFILSMGMAVDANVLIFERMKEELRNGRALEDAMHEGFARAWLSIRDGNLSGIIASIILFWLGTSLVKGFALTLGIGILVSMFTAIVITRTYLFALGVKSQGGVAKFLFGSGITK